MLRSVSCARVRVRVTVASLAVWSLSRQLCLCGHVVAAAAAADAAADAAVVAAAAATAVVVVVAAATR